MSLLALQLCRNIVFIIIQKRFFSFPGTKQCKEESRLRYAKNIMGSSGSLFGLCRKGEKMAADESVQRAEMSH